MNEYIYGVHSVEEVLKAGRRKVFSCSLTQKLQDRLKNDALFSSYLQKIACSIVDSARLDKLLPSHANHQGIVLEVEERNILNEEELYKANPQKIVILDQITDIGNVGSIVRSAFSFGIEDIVVTEYNSANIGSDLLKASSGYAERVKFYKVTNLSSLLKNLKEKEYWSIGLDGYAKANIGQLQKFKGDKTAIILGRESKGIRDLVKKNCDLLVKIPMSPKSESLNVANAATIAFWELYDA